MHEDDVALERLITNVYFIFEFICFRNIFSPLMNFVAHMEPRNGTLAAERSSSKLSALPLYSITFSYRTLNIEPFM
jgi:hypothetical protein